MAAVLAMLVFAGVAQADPWRPVAQSCVAASDFAGNCSVVRGSAGLWKVVVAPGGFHAYGISYSPAAVMVFDRNPATGALTQRAGTDGCLAAPAAYSGCKATTPLNGANGVVMSPDGANLYVVSGASGSNAAPGMITVFDRNSTTGELTQKSGLAACVSTDGSLIGVADQCTRGRGITSVSTLVISPDGRFIYTAGIASLGVFQRNPDTGTLTQAPDGTGCATSNGLPAGCTTVNGLYAARQITLAPDGRSLYVPSQNGPGGNSLAIFDRDPATGVIAQKVATAGCIGAAPGCGPEPRLANAIAATTSPDGRNVYVSVADGILTFARAADGSLSFQSCVSDSGGNGCSSGRNLSFMSYSDMSPDGQTLVVATDTGAAPGIAMFDRDAGGNLTQGVWGDGCLTPNGAAYIKGQSVPGQCLAHPALGTNGQISFFDDGNFIAGSYASSAAVAFKRDLYPRCVSQSFNVTQNTAAPLPFSCVDRNGDAMTYSIASNPIAGAVGAVDQTGARVFYNPFSGFLGTDSVRYKATSTGLTSNEATMSISVVPPVVPPPPVQRPRTVTSPVSYSWGVKGSRLTIRQMVVRRLPTGATVTLTCSGKRCPLKKLTIKRSRKSTMNVLNAKALSGKNRGKKTYRAGQTVDVRVAAPGMNTKVLRFKLRKGKVPKHRTYCVPFGEKRAKRSCS